MRGHLEEVIWVVFDDVEIPFLGYGVDGFSALDTLCCAGGVLTCRDGVEEPGSRLSIMLGRIPT